MITGLHPIADVFRKTTRNFNKMGLRLLRENRQREKTEKKMAEETPERTGEKLKLRVAELERVCKALVKAMKEFEDETGEAVMPVGDYFGIKFEE